MTDQLAGWLKYYRDLGFTHLYKPVARSSGTHDSGAGNTNALRLNIESSAVVNPGHDEIRNMVETKPQLSNDSITPPAASKITPVVVPKPEKLFAAIAPRETLEAIHEDLGDCRRCKLFEGRKSIVFGSGNP